MATKGQAKVTEAEYRILSAFRHALREFLRFSEQAAVSAGLTPQQHQALLAVKGFPAGGPLTIGQLADRLQIHHHSAVGLVDRLVRKNLVRRTRDKKDRRQVCVALTASGERVLAKLSAAHKEQLRRCGPEIELLLKRLRGAF